VIRRSDVIYVVIVVVVLLAIVGALVHQRRRAARLQEGLGPEYDRAFEVRPLGAVQRDRWRAIQARFVDQPAAALGDADTLVIEVMLERGYPVEDSEHYRKAHALHTRSRASTEELREALLHYRALFAELLEPPTQAVR
jgi:hypothetical protein